MRRAGKIVVLSWMFFLLAAPLMACLSPGATLTAEERECCRKMAEQCERMRMPSSHSCCRTTIRESNPYLASPRISVRVVHQESPAVLPVKGMSLQARPIPHVRMFSNTHAPPESPPETISILRI